MHKRKIKVNPMDQALQILIYLIIIALCLIILLPCLNVVALAFNAERMQRGVAYGSGRDSSPWITSKKYSKTEVLPQLM